MKVPTLAVHTAVGLALLYASAALVHAQPQAVVVETFRATPFMSGGVGKDQQAFMRQAGKNFNLRLEFSERQDNEFIVGTELLITDMQGQPVFVLSYAGPIVNVDLPDGEYRVTARYDGQSESRQVTLRGGAGQDLYFHWKGNPKLQPTAAVGAKATAD